MPAFDCHVFVCCNERPGGHPRGCCHPEGSALRDALKAELNRHGRSELLARVNQAGCLDQCEFGPTLVIYPRGIWYGRVTLADVPRIVEQTILGRQVLEDLRIPDECLNTKGRVAWTSGPASGGPVSGGPVSGDSVAGDSSATPLK